MTKPLLAILLLTGAPGVAAPPPVEEVDFNRDIRPILSDKCFHCHGPDASNQKSEFRLDTFESATLDLGGFAGVVPGNLEDSELHQRIRLGNRDDEVMPPLDSNRVLTRREKDLLDAWILQGAEYDLHWAFKRLERPALLDLDATNKGWVRNPIDSFVANRLQKEGLRPSPEATLEILSRRAALTLTGISPQPADAGGLTYEEAIDHFLTSIHYAERQALRWLDAARYADTDGYQNDAERKNWPWRDWVIKSFHENLPFDQFTIEQLAGDMLPDASNHQILATAFNRNHRQNSEGGALAPEFYVENVIDRVETTSTVWLGLTMGCARCHDHKYDPVSQREFYQLFGYFNNIGEKGIGKGVSANPVLQIGSPLAEVPAELQAELATAQETEKKVKADSKARLKAWIETAGVDLSEEAATWRTETTATAEVRQDDGTLTREPDGSWLFSGQNVGKVSYVLTIPADGKAISGLRLDALPHPTFGKPRQLARSVNGNFVLSELRVAVKGGQPVSLASAAATFEQDKYPVAAAIDGNPGSGWAVFGNGVKPETVSATIALAQPITLAKGESLEIQLSFLSTFADHNIGRFKIHTTDGAMLQEHAALLDPKVRAALQTPAKRRSAAERKTLAAYFATIDAAQKDASGRRAAVEKKLSTAGGGKVPVMVMREQAGKRTPAYFLDRGQYDAPDKSEELPRGVPASLYSSDEESQPKDRLELARWLVSRENPLTARVTVNRIWQDHFGIGLVKTPEDFGAQGEVPFYHDLLDWLAVEFIESGWDVKALHRLIVTSATYRQSSAVSPAMLEKDPMNRLLARGPRFRLDGFAIRDNALLAAGLLNPEVGGPPVKPYQPTGLWNSVAGRANIRYAVSKGDDLYRKSMYSYWKRAVNPPRQLIFDAGGREACNVAARRTNTPLQALVLMNDVTFLEAARHLAQRTLQDERLASDQERLAAIFRRVTLRQATPETLAILQDNLAWFRVHFADNPGEAAAFLKAGASPRDESLPAATHAAWTAAAHLVLNLDQAVTVQ